MALWGWYIDPVYFLIFVFTFLISIGAQIMVSSAYVTLPIEFDASPRGLQLLDQSGLMRAEADRQGSRQVLRAAALTYVAAAVTAVLNMLYYLRLAGRGRR